MTRSALLGFAWAGLALAALGLFVGLLPLKVDGATCGGAFWQSDDAHVADLTSAMFGGDGSASQRCDDKRSTVRIVAIPLIVVGGIGGLVAGISAGDRRED